MTTASFPTLCAGKLASAKTNLSPCPILAMAKSSSGLIRGEIPFSMLIPKFSKDPGKSPDRTTERKNYLYIGPYALQAR